MSIYCVPFGDVYWTALHFSHRHICEFDKWNIYFRYHPLKNNNNVDNERNAKHENFNLYRIFQIVFSSLGKNRQWYWIQCLMWYNSQKWRTTKSKTRNRNTLVRLVQSKLQRLWILQCQTHLWKRYSAKWSSNAQNFRKLAL